MTVSKGVTNVLPAVSEEGRNQEGNRGWAAEALASYFASTEFTKWFPQQPLARIADAKATLICFHSAGSDATIFSSKMVRREPCKNELVDFCETRRIRMLCPILPGRASRYRESLRTQTVLSLVSNLFDVLRPLLEDDAQKQIPLFLAGHSLGSYFVYHFFARILSYQRSEPRSALHSGSTAKLPRALFITAALPPWLPRSDRPWKPAMECNDLEFKDNMRKWNVPEEVFAPRIWPSFENMMREDIDLMDRLEPCPPLDISGLRPPELILLKGAEDLRIDEASQRGWAAAFKPSIDDFQYYELEGNHNLFYSKLARSQWNQAVTDHIKASLEIHEAVNCQGLDSLRLKHGSINPAGSDFTGAPHSADASHESAARNIRRGSNDSDDVPSGF